MRLGLLAAVLLTLSSQLSVTANSTALVCRAEDTRIDDVYSLDEWQNSTRSFGEALFGALDANPMERLTIQKFLNIAKKANTTNMPKLQLTTRLMRGYFAASPAFLNSTQGQGSLMNAGLVVESELEALVIDNFYNHAARNETYFYSLSYPEQSVWLMKRVNWQRILVRALVAQPYENFAPPGVNGMCYKHAIHMLRSFYTRQQWAIEMLDASGKLPIGLFVGNLNWIGQYDQCHLITSNGTNVLTQQPMEPFQGSYCDIKMEVPKEIGTLAAPGKKLYLRLGLCFPDTCNSTDVKLIMANLKVFGYSLPKVESARCHSESPSATGKFLSDGVAWFAAVLMGIVVLLVIISTFIEGILWYGFEVEKEAKPGAAPHLVTITTYNIDGGQQNGGYIPSNNDTGLSEIKLDEKTTSFYPNGKVENGTAEVALEENTYEKMDNGSAQPPELNVISIEGSHSTVYDTLKKVVQAFSLYSNLPALLSTAEPSGALKSLDALRVFNMNWIILGHVYSIGAVFLAETMSNAKLAAEKIKNPTFMGVYAAMLAVDSYFFISGLLVSYLFLKSCAKNKNSKQWRMQMIMYYVHRLLRILPLYAILILVYAAFGPYLGSGPLFDWQNTRIRDCNHNWWANLLFINNFYEPRNMCLGWSWYLSNDMQFYWLAPIMLIPLYFNAIAGFVVVLAFFIAHWVATYLIWEQTGGKSFMQDEDIFYEAYITPYCRIGPYLVGILLGWLFYKGYKLKKSVISNVIATVCWMMAAGLMGVVVYIQYLDVKEHGVQGHSWNKEQRSIYETFARDCWALALAWIVYACNHGYAGFIAHILNWRGWAPLGRVTFAVYLVHPIVIFIYVGNRRDLNHVDDFSVSYMYAGYVILSYVGGAVLSLIYEVPAAALEKLALGNIRKPKKS